MPPTIPVRDAPILACESGGAAVLPEQKPRPERSFQESRHGRRASGLVRGAAPNVIGAVLSVSFPKRDRGG